MVQGKEPTHFTAMFGGKMTVFQVHMIINIFCGNTFLSKGGHASSFDGEEGQNIGIPDSYLLQVCNVTISKDANFLLITLSNCSGPRHIPADLQGEPGDLVCKQSQHQ